MSHMSLSRRHFMTALGAGSCWPITALAGVSPNAAITLRITRQMITLDGKTGSAVLFNNTLPGPILRFREGQDAIIHVHNDMDEPTSVHWHGIRLPSDQDGVPGLSYKGIMPGESFTYRFPLHQSGTYWYHSHSAGHEPRGLYGAMIIDPAGSALLPSVERDYVLLLSEWTDVAPAQIVSTLKMQSDYYNFRQRSVASLPKEAWQADGLIPALKGRLEWSGRRMSATDISDVSGIIYSYLMNGCPAHDGWSGRFRPGERVRLHIINGAAMTLFDVRVPGLEMSVVEADGNPVVPVPVDEFRIGVGETYVVDVVPKEERAYTIFAQSEDRTGYAYGTLSPRAGMKGPVPSMDPRPVRGMADMGMDMQGMMRGGKEIFRVPAAEVDDPGPPPLSVENQMVAAHPLDRTDSPGDGLEHNGRRVLAYTQLRALHRTSDVRPPSREIILHLTGNMERYIWGFNGRKFSESGPIRLTRYERVRFVIINDTMMEHPLHLHGLWSELENGQGEYRPLKHTIISQPGSRMSFLVTADVPGLWAYHCHLLYHMETGMFRTVQVS